MKRMFGVALLALPFAVGSVHAQSCCWPFNVKMGGSFYFQSNRGLAGPQAGPWYLYWPLEAHFVAPAPTGYPYWPSPQVLPPTSIGGPAVPPPPFFAPPPPTAVVPPPVTTAPPTTVAPPPVTTTPPGIPTPQRAPTTTPQLQLPPYLQPTSYYAPVTSGQPPSYWYDR
jgi:hypothetical protein